MRVYRLLLLCMMGFAALTAGCMGGGTSNGNTPSVRGDVAQCTEAYAFAPAGYVINIVSGDAVILDPLANDFQLFCDVDSARKGLTQALSAGQIPQGDWKVYRVYGPWSELVTEASPGVYHLKRPAPLVDWVE